MDKSYFFKRAFYQGISDSYTHIRSVKKIDGNWKVLYRKFFQGLKKLFVNEFEASIRMAYLNGYLYHQKSVKEDRDLYEWVIKKSYLE